jgi:replication factor A1
MAIKDLQARMGSVNLTFTIADKGDVREFEKFGKTGRVCTVTAQDDTGKVALTLWNDDVDKVNVGDKVEIKNGYVGEYQGELQLTAGKFGELKVVGKGEVPEGTPTAEAAPEPVADDIPEEPYKEEEAVENGDESP